MQQAADKSWVDLKDFAEALRIARKMAAVTVYSAAPDKKFMTNQERDHNIYRRWMAGQTLRAIGTQYGCSGERVRQIVRRTIRSMYIQRDPPGWGDAEWSAERSNEWGERRQAFERELREQRGENVRNSRGRSKRQRNER